MIMKFTNLTLHWGGEQSSSPVIEYKGGAI